MRQPPNPQPHPKPQPPRTHTLPTHPPHPPAPRSPLELVEGLRNALPPNNPLLVQRRMALENVVQMLTGGGPGAAARLVWCVPTCPRLWR